MRGPTKLPSDQIHQCNWLDWAPKLVDAAFGSALFSTCLHTNHRSQGNHFGLFRVRWWSTTGFGCLIFRQTYFSTKVSVSQCVLLLALHCVSESAATVRVLWQQCGISRPANQIWQICAQGHGIWVRMNENGTFLKWGYTQIIHVNGNFHYKPSSYLGTSIYGNPISWASRLCGPADWAARPRPQNKF